MQPASKSKKWALEAIDDSEEPPTKMQALELPEGESDGEYEVVPKKSRKTSPPKEIAPKPTPTLIVENVNQKADEVMTDVNKPSATDDDWLRSRTNRLLDLMDPEDIVMEPAASVNPNAVAETPADQDEAANHKDPVNDNEIQEELVEEELDKLDPVIEAIKTNGRLFVRNLPYTASEDDIREHFRPFGTLEEVCLLFRLSFILPLLYDEYPDRDSLCFGM